MIQAAFASQLLTERRVRTPRRPGRSVAVVPESQPQPARPASAWQRLSGPVGHVPQRHQAWT
jgi:hypothetical protein